MGPGGVVSAQIVPLRPGNKLMVRPNDDERIAELEGHVAIARQAALEAWLAAQGLSWRRFVDALYSHGERSESFVRLVRAEEARFAAWWDGAR